MKYIAEFERRILGSDVSVSYNREYVVKDFSSAYFLALSEINEANDSCCDQFEYFEIKGIRKED